MTSLAHRPQQTSLVDLLDRLLDKGVVVAGDATISVADVGLLFASVRLVLTSVDKAWEVKSGQTDPEINTGRPGGRLEGGEARMAAPVRGLRLPASSGDLMAGGRDSMRPGAQLPAPAGAGEPALPEQASNGMAQLVVTLAETLREVLEREALRRMERGTLTASETERLGLAFLAMKRQIDEFKRVFNFRDDDLNLDLGPLGRLR